MLGEIGIGDHAGGHHGHEHVHDNDEQHAHADAERHVLVRVLGLLRGGGHHVRSDEREEHERRAREDLGTPYTDGVMPVANCHNGWVITPVTAEEPSTVEAGWLGGMNGVKLRP